MEYDHIKQYFQTEDDMLYTITANGKSMQINASSAENAVRSQICWYGYDTIITVSDSNGNVEKYRKTKSRDDVTGYTDLIKEVCG